jgi:cytochrome c-type biogenesis protein CcmH
MAATDTTPKASLTDIENDVMCVSCHEPLAVAQSPQAIAERNYVRTLIAQGQTKAQIEQALVGQYGPAVLGKPPAHGFNLTVYILPPLILIAGIGTLLLLLPKWRRRSKANAAPRGPTPAVDRLSRHAASTNCATAVDRVRPTRLGADIRAAPGAVTRWAAETARS